MPLVNVILIYAIIFWQIPGASDSMLHKHAVYLVYIIHEWFLLSPLSKKFQTEPCGLGSQV